MNEKHDDDIRLIFKSYILYMYSQWNVSLTYIYVTGLYYVYMCVCVRARGGEKKENTELKYRYHMWKEYRQ